VTAASPVSILRDACACAREHHDPLLVAVTGGPGAGKTAVLEVARRHFCRHVGYLPESASLLFRGGFPRRSGEPARRAAQRAIFRVQRELEILALEEREQGVVLCDRGTVDGVVYWPAGAADYFAAVGTTREAELARYRLVIHLRTPREGHGYDHSNPMRIESPAEARRLDDAIIAAWDGHPQRVVIDSSEEFVEKLAGTLAAIGEIVPACCRSGNVQRETLVA
jgi:hypothetical protein